MKQPTARKWFSVLQASYIMFNLQPHFNNFNKRLIKAPKLYFFDTGLLCYLLRIQNPEQLESHPFRGAILENWVISEVLKSFYNTGLPPPVYYWRDQHGHEVDLVLDRGHFLELCEIKAGATFNEDFVLNLRWLNSLQNEKSGCVIYGGTEAFEYQEFKVEPWLGSFATKLLTADSRPVSRS